MATHSEEWADAGWGGLTLLKSEFRFADGRRADLVFRQHTGWLRRLVVVEVKRGRVGVDAVNLRWPRAILVGETIDGEAEREVERIAGLCFIPLATFGTERVAA
ncbi:hypothetical protein ACFPK1_09240 [Actinomycetospora rhizophila]|uniref:DUF91 domain-containing protein n=1 Tax=Actinomycetospora rhizophila TaxID=1416876 RepID=A0ABV9ZBI1_9PSEU